MQKYNLEIEDEDERQFTCGIRRGSGEANLKSEWKKSYVTNKLKENNKIQINMMNKNL